MSNDPLIDGVNVTVVTVADRDQHVRFYREVLGWGIVGEIEIGAEESRALWDTGAARITILAPEGVDTGVVHLFEAEGATPEISRYPVGTGLGLFAIDSYVHSIPEARTRAEANGGRWGGGPEKWELGTAENPVTVEQARIEAPEGVNLVLVVPGKPRHTDTWAANPDAIGTELTSVVINSPDIDRSIAYWGPDGLGLPVAYDARFTAPGLSRLVGAEEGEEFRMAFGVGERTARLEMFGRTVGGDRAHDPADDLRATQRHGRLTGMSALGVRVRDLDRALEVNAAAGGETVSGPVALTESPYGADHANLAVVRTPEGVLVEFAG